LKDSYLSNQNFMSFFVVSCMLLPYFLPLFSLIPRYYTSPGTLTPLPSAILFSPDTN
jgi:hypothetical protein